MKSNFYPYLSKGILSICTILFLTIVSSAQFEPTENFKYLKYFSNSSGGNSTFTRPYIFIDHTELGGKLNNSNTTTGKKVYSISNLERKAFDLMNMRRGASGLRPVIWNEDIARVARLHSQSMAINKYFSHQGIDGLWVDERANRNGLKKWRAISENIAYNRGYDNPAEFAVERWMKSTSHRNNALNDRWEESGIGVAIGSDGETIYFTQVFLDK
jgi:uncharacterized protein YkwD